MNLHTAPAILSVAVIATLLLPAGALVGTMGAPTENLFDGEPSIEMTSHDGPNGAYVETAADDELRIDVSSPGVNPEALTRAEGVFDLTNTDSTDVTVWVTHDGDGSVTLFEAGTGDRLDTEADAIELAPGETVTVSIDVDSTGSDSGEKLLSTVTVHAEFETEADDPAPPPGPDPGTDPTPDPGPVEPIEPIDPDADVEIRFEDDDIDDPGVRVRSVDPAELDVDPREEIDRPPRAVISRDAVAGETTETDEDIPDADGLDAEAFDTLTLVDEPVELSGERSTIGSAEGISDRDRIVRLVDITVPPERRSQPATVRMRVDPDRFGDGDPDEATIGHRTEEGWELLETRLVDRTDEAVVLEAETPGFSMFAVFAEANVRYEWELPDGTVLEGRQIDPTFEEPGFYDVQLTVTDAFDRADTAPHRVLANDVPEATVEVVDREGDQVTLRANVENEMGETEVTWTFPDGTEATGEEVTHTLEDGEHEISLHVIDEYGAESKADHTVAVGPPGMPAAVADALGMDLELLVQMGLLSTIGLALGLGYRRVPWGVLRRTRRRGPKITVSDLPSVDSTAGQVTIDSLEVEGFGSKLDTIVMNVLDDTGRTVIEKQLTISGGTTYTATETLVLPPGIELGTEGRYTVRIEATDTNGRNSERHLNAAASDPDTETARTSSLKA